MTNTQADPVVYPDVFVDGTWREPLSGAAMESIDPATEDVWAIVPEAGEEDADAAVGAARKALAGPWSTLTGSQRGALLFELASLVRAEAHRLAVLESTDNGKPLRDTEGEIQRAADWFRFYGGAADKINGEQIPYSLTSLAYTRKEPVGVVAAITPWNSPLLMYSWKLAPALASGNTVVLKPAEQTPVTALELAKLIDRAGFPAGVVNVIPGLGQTAGARLAAHPGVNKVTFTGETTTAQTIMRAAAGSLKRLTFECGGKGAHILFEDADLDRALVVALHSAFRSTGQSCSLGSRLFVHRRIHDEVVSRLTAMTEVIRVGPPLDERTHIGPHTSSEQLDKTLRYIGLGKSGDATLVTGGIRPPAMDRGYYVTPAIFTTDNHQSPLAQDEIFGPVLTILPFEAEEEVIALANDVRYGLVAGLWTSDISRGHRVAHHIDAGLVSVNTYRPVHYTLPYGGYKLSGIGREHGLGVLDGYTETKTVVVDLSTGPVSNPFAS